MMNPYIDIVFDGPPSHESGRFVETEGPGGVGVRLGTWISRGNGHWALRIFAGEIGDLILPVSLGAQYNEQSRAMKAARFLFTLIRQNNPNAREPNWRMWARTFDLLFRVDKREPAEVARLIRWCQQDDFWHRNILSPDKFRKQYDRLKLESKSTKGGRREVRSARLQED